MSHKPRMREMDGIWSCVAKGQAYGVGFTMQQAWDNYLKNLLVNLSARKSQPKAYGRFG